MQPVLTMLLARVNANMPALHPRCISIQKSPLWVPQARTRKQHCQHCGGGRHNWAGGAARVTRAMDDVNAPSAVEFRLTLDETKPRGGRPPMCSSNG
jgi:hypothetical protein